MTRRTRRLAWLIVPALVAPLVLCACAAQKSRQHTAAVEQLVADSPAAVGSKFEPISPEERLQILGENGHAPYTIGVGDGLRITGDTAFLKNFGETSGGEILPSTVKPDGNIYLPELGAVPARGLTVIELQAELRKRMLKYKENPFASVDVVQHHSQKFYVLGAVNNPGVYPVDGSVTLLGSFGLAGGASKQADMEQAYIVRESKILPVSLADMIKRGDMSRNITMRAGDLVFVPERADAKVYVVGEVKNPGPVPLVHGRLTLAAATAAAGGLNAESADINQVRIYRGGWGNPRVFTISAEEVYKYGESIYLRSGDRIMVAPTANASNARAAQLVLPYLNTALATVLGVVAVTR